MGASSSSAKSYSTPTFWYTLHQHRGGKTCTITLLAWSLLEKNRVFYCKEDQRGAFGEILSCTLYTHFLLVYTCFPNILSQSVVSECADWTYLHIARSGWFKLFSSFDESINNCSGIITVTKYCQDDKPGIVVYSFTKSVIH